MNIEDEELDEIEYLEILSIDEIIRDNPSFIAFNDKELYNELFNIFNDEKKATALKLLFYRIINNDKQNYKNFMFVTNARKKNFSELNKEEDSEYFNSLAKLNTSRYLDAKNRYFFAIEYDNDQNILKIKPEKMILTELLTEEKSAFPVYYPIFVEDDVNIPVIAVYYRIPYATDADYMYKKVISHHFNTKNVNYIKSDGFSDIKQLMKTSRPSIDMVLKDLTNSDDMIDYETLDNFLRKYNMSMEFLVEDDFTKLCDFVAKLITDKERKNVYKSFKIKSPDFANKKMVFFDRLNTTLKLISLSEKAVEFLENVRITLNDDSMHNAEVILLYNNIYDIIENINNGNVNLQQVVDNIKAVQKRIILSASIGTINNLLETSQNLDEINDEFERIRSEFAYARTHLFDFENDKKRFVSFYNELKEIQEADNEDNYEGIPAILKNNDYEEFEEMGDNIIQEEGENIKNNSLDKYWLNLKYREEHGFIELLKVILPIIHTMSTIACLEIDLFLLCEELFKRFREVPTKANMFRKIFADSSIVLADTVINDISKINPRISLSVDLNMGAEIREHIMNVNKEYSSIVNSAIVCAVSWYIIYLQEKILENAIIINDDLLNPIYVDKWFAYGAPLQIKEKNGIVQYVCSVIDDMLLENNDYIIAKNYQVAINTFIEDIYKDRIKELREHYAEVKNKKVEKGVIAQRIMIENVKNKKFDRIASDYIDALVYMPGVNYKKIHKFLLGCCLQRIGKDFEADIDLQENARKDLIDIKRKFATRKETNKKRYARFLPFKDNFNEQEEDDIHFMKIEDYKYNIAHSDVLEWLDSMLDKNPLIPNNIILEIKNNTRKCIEYIDKYIKILQTTARNKNSDLDKHFIISDLNYKSLLFAILKILNAKENDNDNVIQLQKLSIESIRNIIPEMHKLNKIMNADNRQDIERINAFICARAMCLPCNPDLSVNNYLMSVMDIPQIFIETNAQKIHNSILNQLKFGKFPSIEEITSFLNNKREENKQMKLNILNNKSVEENQLISKLKQAGIKNDLMKVAEEPDDIGNYYVGEAREEGDINEGESEYKMGEEDDYNDELDRMDMGFIYAK